MLEGARRVGKTTIAEEFARNEYDSYILIDFSNIKRQDYSEGKEVCQYGKFRQQDN